VLSQADRLDEAIAAYEQAVLFKPNHLSALCNLGNTLRARGRYQEAIKRYEQAIAVNPDYADAHWDLSLTLLQLGDFERGWREHEWRMQCSALAKPVQYSQPQWAGESLVGKSILLHPEQGLGDTLQFVRYVQVVADLGARVYLGTQPELHALLKLIPGADMVVSYGQLPVFDVQCPLLSLPFVLGTRLDSVPAKVPYLFAEEGLVQQWAQKLGPSNGKKRVGLVWAGSKTHKNDRNRSIDPAKLSPLLQVPGFQFFSLQKGATGSTILAPPGAELIDHTGELNDFIDTAALIANLDLVISVDTSVAHLAGGMGKPVWLLLPRDPDWRWLLDRDDSPWYPTMKLFRQTTARDWEPVVQRMARELEAANF
jgi:hypothetical protein